jgi:hypothetical protein
MDTRSATGAIEKVTSLTTNDPAQPRLNLLVKASVNPAERSACSDADRQVSVLVSQAQ